MHFLLVTIPVCSFCNIRGNWNCCFVYLLYKSILFIRGKRTVNL